MNTKIILRFAAFLFFLFALSIPLYFIWSDLFIQEFDSDVAESVIWAQASLESGSLLNPDFGYTHLLPFGGQFIFVPIVACFGVGIFSLRLGLCIWAVIFSVVLLLFFRIGLRWAIESSFLSSAAVIIILSATELLREIYWAHLVHYNLSVFYLLFSMIFLRFLFEDSSSKRIIGLIGLEASLILGSTNDIAVLLFFSFALLFGILLERFCNRGIRFFLTKENLILLLQVVSGICAGFAIGKIITRNISTVYSDQFTVFSPADEWMENLMRFPNNWLQMFSLLPDADVPFFSSVGIKLMIRIAVAFLVAGLSVRSIFLYSSLKSRLERIFLGVHWFISAAILFVYIFGIIYLNPWRITPMLFTGVMTALIILKHDLTLLADKKPFVQLFAVFSVVSLALYIGIGGVTVFRQSINENFWTGQKTILRILKDNNLTYGYSLDHWFANSITVLTDESIKSREVVIKDGHLAPSFLQSNNSWYSDQPDVEKYFLICLEDDYWSYPEIAEGAIETFRANQERTFRKGQAGFFIFVYDKNLF